MITLLLAAQLATAAPSVEDRVNTALLLESLSASSIALGLTMACTSDGTCRELNPVMARVIGTGPTRTVLLKSGVQFAAHYGAWRLTRGRTRVALLAALAAVNTIDAVHDVRQMRRLAR